MKTLKVEEILDWLLKELGIITLGYEYSKKGEHPFEFIYPCKNKYDIAKGKITVKDGVVTATSYVGIKILNASVEEAFDIMLEYNFDSVFLCNRFLINTLRIKNNERDVAYCFYSSLHEIGHYFHFVSIETEADYIEFRKEYTEKRIA